MDITTNTPKSEQANTEDFFTQVPNVLRSDNRLDGNAKILAGMIASLAKAEGYCWSTNGWFAEQFGVSESTILRWLKQLEKYGYIRTQYKEKTCRGTDRMIYMADYPKLVRDSTPQSVAVAITRAAVTQDKGDNPRGNDSRRGGVISATPTPSTLTPLPPQKCYPRGVISATQLDTVLKTEKEKRKETLSSPLPPKHGGTPPAAAARSSEIKTSFSFPEQKEPDAATPRQMTARTRAVRQIARECSAHPPPPDELRRRIEARMKEIEADEARAETEGRDGMGNKGKTQ